MALDAFQFLSSFCFALLSVSFVSHKPTTATAAKKCCPTRNQLCVILNKHCTRLGGGVSAGRARCSSNWRRCSINGIKPACTSLRVTTGCLLPHCLPFTVIIFYKVGIQLSKKHRMVKCTRPIGGTVQRRHDWVLCE